MGRPRKQPVQLTYTFEPIGEGKVHGARPECHFRSFRRIPVETPQVADDSEDQDGSEDDKDDDDQDPDRRHAKTTIAATSTATVHLPPSTDSEVFQIGDIVYLPSSYQAPLVGVLTQLWTLDERVSDEKETIYGVARLFHWPEWMSTIARKRMTGITSQNEIFYTHKASSLSKRNTKTAAKSGQDGDDFEAGPSLHDYSFEVEELIAKIYIHPTEQQCMQLINQLSAQSSSSTSSSQQRSIVNKTHCLYKNRAYPRHLFCERAVDPNRELFWKIDWNKLIQRGVQDGGWDLVDDSNSQLRNLTTDGQGVNDLVQEIAEARGIVIHDPQQKKKQEAKARALARAASLKEVTPSTPSTPKSGRGRSRKDSLFLTPTSTRTMRTAAMTPRSQKATSTPSKTRGRKPKKKRSGSSSSDDSDDSFQSGDELQVEQDLLLKPHDRDPFASSSSEDDDEDQQDSDSSFDSNHIGRQSEDDQDDPQADHDDDDFEESLKKTPRKRGRPPIEGVPMTPSKRRILSTPRKNPYMLNSPARAFATPRSRARLLGLKMTRNLPHPSLPLRPPKLSSLTMDEITTLSPHERAKRLLHVGATPDHLPCREEQYEEIMACVQDAVEEGIGGCVYVSGVPGTGKTATVREVIRCLTAQAERNEMNPFSFVEINGIKMADASQAYSLLWSAISGGQKASPKTALNLLSSHFARVGATVAGGAAAGGAGVGAGPGRAATVVLMDELDQLVTARQDVMYNMFNWPNTRGSRLVVIAVANTMDLPERVLHPKVASRLGMTRITFLPYTDRQLVEIIRSRLGLLSEQPDDGGVDSSLSLSSSSQQQQDQAATQGCDSVFTSDSITYVSKRVSNVSGDARRMLDVCRRAIELVQLASSSSPTSPITIMNMKQVLDSMVQSGKMSHIIHLSLHSKILLLSILSCLRRTGLVETDLIQVYSHHRAICRMYHIQHPIKGNLWEQIDLDQCISKLTLLGFIICVGQGSVTGSSRGFARVLLACQEDEVRLAFEHDPDERLRKMLS